MKANSKLLKSIIGRIVYFFGFPIRFFALHKTTRARVIAVQSGRVILVKSLIGNGKWELPGGGVSFEDTPEMTAIREFKEELGIDIDRSKMKELEPKLSNDIYKIKTHYFLITLPANEQFEVKLGKEILEYKWFKYNRLKNLSLHINARDALKDQNMLE